MKKASHGVKSPWRAGPPLSRTDWEQYCERLAAESAKSDIPTQDYYLPADFPLVLDEAEWRSLARIAEKLTAEALEAERELVRRTDLHAKLGVPESIREVFREGAAEESPVEAGRYMRFDFHLTREGWRISEVNADTLGGFNVASLFTELMAPYFPKWEAPPDPVRALAKGVRAIVERGELVGIIRRKVHERDCEAKYLARELRRQGMRAVIASPGEVRWEAGRASIESAMGSGRPSMLIRFLDAEWLPKLRPGSEWKKWFKGSRTPISNPGTSLLIQSKRFPLVWGDLETEVPTWRAMIPETRSPSELGKAAERDWVLKSVFGRVGTGVAIAGINSGLKYRAAARQARQNPEGWVAQRRFEMEPVETASGTRHVCLGIFTVDGKAAGAFGRLSKTALVDQKAQDVAVLLRGGK